ncbi:hypothetical protein BCR36DRAFT_292732 [Piromyces finnis]|uniref:Uncharacterized protein n=1 Tax=Piromyces finnis TaxID=1754191 RepID=A0A1Y1V787_9FUNG|nr:hypothetical protein BCR36DRAFT_292732 [Piromyces finnis]|eukprot:ORX48890.1 hypothetical protein BCR36DRAFT_292732 [Piromyces finnis]
MLCNDFIIRYVDSCKNVCSNETSNTKDLRNSNRGRSVYNFGNKKELIEKLICSMCFDDNEKKLHQIEGYRIITPENILELNKNNNEDTTNLMNHIIKIITNNNLEEYCCKRPHQAFLMYKLFCLLPNLLKMTKDNIIEEWKKYLFKYNLIVIL